MFVSSNNFEHTKVIVVSDFFQLYNILMIYYLTRNIKFQNNISMRYNQIYLLCKIFSFFPQFWMVFSYMSTQLRILRTSKSLLHPLYGSIIILSKIHIYIVCQFILKSWSLKNKNKYIWTYHSKTKKFHSFFRI